LTTRQWMTENYQRVETLIIRETVNLD